MTERHYNAIVLPAKANNNASERYGERYDAAVLPVKANNNASVQRERFRATEDRYEMVRQLRITSTQRRVVISSDFAFSFSKSQKVILAVTEK